MSTLTSYGLQRRTLQEQAERLKKVVWDKSEHDADRMNKAARRIEQLAGTETMFAVLDAGKRVLGITDTDALQDFEPIADFVEKSARMMEQSRAARMWGE